MRDDEAERKVERHREEAIALVDGAYADDLEQAARTASSDLPSGLRPEERDALIAGLDGSDEGRWESLAELLARQPASRALQRMLGRMIEANSFSTNQRTKSDDTKMALLYERYCDLRGILKAAKRGKWSERLCERLALDILPEFLPGDWASRIPEKTVKEFKRWADDRRGRTIRLRIEIERSPPRRK